MKTSLVLALSLVASLAEAKCKVIGQRRAWHTFTNAEKDRYIEAELCLMKLPATLGLPGARTRFDELQATHQLQAFRTHYVGAFLPFHRAMMFAHEQAIRNDCGYPGYQPYWQEQRDAGNFTHSELLSPVHGFGGNGTGPNLCITDGPFVNYTNALGPAYEVTDHCINRNVNETFSALASQEEVDKCLAKTNWKDAWACMEDNVHTGGHAGMGAQARDPVSSPGDPLFYLHHTWLDKVWADWQDLDNPKRFFEFSGNNVMPTNLSFFPTRPASIPQPTGADGDPGTETTFQHVLNMYGNIPNLTIAEVMDTRGNRLCYEYVEPDDAPNKL